MTTPLSAVWLDPVVFALQPQCAVCGASDSPCWLVLRGTFAWGVGSKAFCEPCAAAIARTTGCERIRAAARDLLARFDGRHHELDVADLVAFARAVCSFRE